MPYLKRIFPALCVAVSMAGRLAAQQTPGSFVLNGTYTGAPGAMLYLNYAVSADQPVRDSTQVKDGSFQFRGKITEPAVVYLQVKQANAAPTGVQLFIEPAVMQLRVDGSNVQRATLTGSVVQKEWEELSKNRVFIQKETEPISRKFDVAKTAYYEAKNRHASEAELDSLQNKMTAIRDEYERYDRREARMDYLFFEKHPASLVTAYYMRQRVHMLSLDSLQLFYNRFGQRTQQSVYGKMVAEEIRKMQNGAPGSMAKNFSTLTIDDKPLQLTDFRGKWVLVDFWASWCIPCRKGNPHLKELYAQYKDRGFEVIGVSDDDGNLAAWKQAVEKDGLPWKHVLRGFKNDPVKGQDRSADISELFGIHTLPTQLLIDPAGKIVARYGDKASAHEELDEALAKAFK